MLRVLTKATISWGGLISLVAWPIFSYLRPISADCNRQWRVKQFRAAHVLRCRRSIRRSRIGAFYSIYIVDYLIGFRSTISHIWKQWPICSWYLSHLSVAVSNHLNANCQRKFRKVYTTYNMWWAQLITQKMMASSIAYFFGRQMTS